MRGIGLAAQSRDGEIGAFLRDWVQAMARNDVQAAAALRAPGYRLVFGAGEELDREAELALLALPSHRILSATLERVGSATGDAGEAQVEAEIRVHGDMGGTAIDGLYLYRFRCSRADGRWLAEQAEAREIADYSSPAAPAPASGSLLRRLAGRAARAVGGGRSAPRPGATFQELAYLPYRPGQDYVLSPYAPVTAAGDPLPVPPEKLWLGYQYLEHGEAHVRTMLDIAERSGFVPADGDRILDLGCGAGRMIRHLRHLADRCEIWGTDISAPHITWCKHHLSPPFHFATTTKVPHLPFADGSFALIYCGSLFTHIDDLADAWLLELRRLLRPGGRLYVTIHDEGTIGLFEKARHSHARVVKEIKQSPTFQAAGHDWGMFTIGRDEDSQVFYKRTYFERMAGNAFDTLSITPEAYYYQTAFLLAPKGRGGQ
jgi:ubiquinone/menaquinone biosynthesis C-methylase UbiE